MALNCYEGQITQAVIKNAERIYSEQRFRSLGDEWFADFSCLLDFASILKKRKSSFLIGEVTENELVDTCLNIAVKTGFESDELFTKARRIVEGKEIVGDFKEKLFRIFYLVGLVGLKLEGYSSYSWSYQGKADILEAEIDENTKVKISPMFNRVLGINLK